jgi:mono/diheme cytochrome c family protein
VEFKSEEPHGFGVFIEIIIFAFFNRGDDSMKKQFVLFIAVIFTFLMVSSAYAKKAECPQPRKTKSAPAAIAKKDNSAKANKANGKKLYNKTAKPMACKMCHGDKGDGLGKLGAAFKSPVAPRNFTCSKTMAKVSPGQMFWIIKNGSKGTGMAKMKLKDKEIWDVIKYIREDIMK